MFHIELGFISRKVHDCVQYSLKNVSTVLVQLRLIARWQGDDDLFSSVASETMKRLANGFDGYEIMNRSRHTVTKYLNDEETP